MKKNVNDDKKIGVKCPGCDIHWLFDWDTYKYVTIDGRDVKRKTLKYRDGNIRKRMILQKCFCGVIISIISYDGMFSPDEWSRIDWEAPENCK